MRITVGDRTHTLLFVHDLRNDAGEELWGQIDPAESTVRICDTLRTNPTKRVGTMLHEVTHLIENECGISLEEGEIKKLSRGLAVFLIDNGWLRPWVTAEVSPDDEWVPPSGDAPE